MHLPRRRPPPPRCSRPLVSAPERGGHLLEEDDHRDAQGEPLDHRPWLQASARPRRKISRRPRTTPRSRPRSPPLQCRSGPQPAPAPPSLHRWDPTPARSNRRGSPLPAPPLSPWLGPPCSETGRDPECQGQRKCDHADGQARDDVTAMNATGPCSPWSMAGVPGAPPQKELDVLSGVVGSVISDLLRQRARRAGHGSHSGRRAAGPLPPTGGRPRAGRGGRSRPKIPPCGWRPARRA